MEQYIKKSAVVAEIERRTGELYDLLPEANSIIDGSITCTVDPDWTNQYNKTF
jgi:hypothetical protein